MKPETYNYKRVRPVQAGNGVTFKITVSNMFTGDVATLQNAHWWIMYLLIHSTAVVDNIQSRRSFAALMCHICSRNMNLDDVTCQVLRTVLTRCGLIFQSRER